MSIEQWRLEERMLSHVFTSSIKLVDGVNSEAIDSSGKMMSLRSLEGTTRRMTPARQSEVNMRWGWVRGGNATTISNGAIPLHNPKMVTSSSPVHLSSPLKQSEQICRLKRAYILVIFSPPTQNYYIVCLPCWSCLSSAIVPWHMHFKFAWAGVNTLTASLSYGS
jgi:hypothetical protein